MDFVRKCFFGKELSEFRGVECLGLFFRIWCRYHEIVFVVDVVDFIIIGDGEMGRGPQGRGVVVLSVKHGYIVYIKTGNPFVFSF